MKVTGVNSKSRKLCQARQKNILSTEILMRYFIGVAMLTYTNLSMCDGEVRGSE